MGRGCRTCLGCILIAVIVIGGALAGLEIVTASQPGWFQALEASFGLQAPPVHFSKKARREWMAFGNAEAAAVVTIRARGCGDDPQTVIGTGWPALFGPPTAPADSTDEIVTAAHVVWHACQVTVTTSEGATFNAQLLGVDLRREDLALLAVPGLSSVVFPIDSSALTPGTQVMMLWSRSNPLAANRPTLVLTSVAKIGSLHLGLSLLKLAPILVRNRAILWAGGYPGESGAPVFGMNGVVGVVEAGSGPGTPGVVVVPVIAGLTELRAWGRGD